MCNRTSKTAPPPTAGTVTVNLDPIPGMTDTIAARWAPVVVGLIPELRQMLLSRPCC
jgi:hypothetical protein